MKQAAAITLVVGVVIALRYLTGDAGSLPAPGIALALGFTLVAAMMTGDLLRRFRLPRITGYLLFGVLIGPYAGNLITETMAQQLRPINGLATTLIALTAGLSLNFERLGRRVDGIGTVIATLLTVTVAGIFVTAWAAWPWLPVSPDAGGWTRVMMAALFTIIIITFSPTMAAAVISETGARGRITDLVLAIVVVADLVALIVFAVLLQGARVVMGEDTGDVSVIVRLTWELGGALALGCLAGALLALYSKYVRREATLVLLGLCGLLTQIGALQGMAPLLAAMTAGLIIQNLAVPQGDTLRTALRAGALPVLVVFFVSTGASLQLDALRTTGMIAIALAVFRLTIIRVGVGAGLQAAALDPGLARPVWAGLISQAGITLGFVSVLAAEFPQWGGHVQTLVVALIAIDELLGPALFRTALAASGEVDAGFRQPLVVVSNREPYSHRYGRDGSITIARSTGGVAVALDALMRERHGVWIATGDGEADREAVDAGDTLRVPPERPSYLLRRLWFDRDMYQAYYAGFANEGLWPLCHLVDMRPRFRGDDWAAYQNVNESFAAAIDDELPNSDTPVFIQDYHLALVASRLRPRRPGVRTALFWHIPWPYPDRLRICPWRRELLTGLLANDLLAFQLERDRRNFMLAAVEELGVDVDEDRIRFGDHVTSIVSAPIGVDYDRIQSVGAGDAVVTRRKELGRELDLRAEIIGIGVDRLDYTKGIPERLDALERLLDARPELRGRMTFVQIGVPSRTDVAGYGAIASEIDQKIRTINDKYKKAGGPPPVVYYQHSLDLTSLVALYRLARFCVVSSLHDGMNLVAKEFVAAREDEDGVLVLSALAGAAQELGSALIINPYDIEEFAAALSQAIDMPCEERRTRMRDMRRVVAGRNVFSWASDILEELESQWSQPLHYAARAPEDVPV